jgi:hypothetical protein
VLNRVIEKLSTNVERRSFLGTAAKAAVALALGIVGVPSAYAVVAFKCCRLCKTSTSTCSGSCTWSWTCPCTTGTQGCSSTDVGHTWKCLEVYDPCQQPACPGSPGPTCVGNKCSKATRIS